VHDGHQQPPDLLQLVPLEHAPDRRPCPQALWHHREGQQPGGLAELLDRQHRRRIRTRTAPRCGQQLGVVEEIHGIVRRRGGVPDELRSRRRLHRTQVHRFQASQPVSTEII
jgi:hypothetical protein